MSGAGSTTSPSIGSRVRHHVARGRRPRNANPYDLSHQASPVVQQLGSNASPVVTPSFAEAERLGDWRNQAQWPLWQRERGEAENNDGAHGTPAQDDTQEIEDGEFEGDTEDVLHELRGVDGDGAVDDGESTQHDPLFVFQSFFS